MVKKITKQPLLLFDGICNLCNSSVQFIIKSDTKNVFTFASLQSDAAKDILLHFNSTFLNLNSVILINNNKIHTKSTAIIKIGQLLGGFFIFVVILYIIPKFIRDYIYDFVAKNRYKWFGKRKTCMSPTASLKNRFL